MAILTIDVLKKIIENVPDDYILIFDDKKTTHQIEDKIEINVSGKKLILRKF